MAVLYEGGGFPEDEKELGGALLNRLERHPERLPLEAFCEEGGWPGPWQAHIDDVRREGDKVVVILSVAFEERVSACCDLGSAKEDLGYHEIPRYGRLELHLESKTGRLTLRPLA